MALSTLPRGLTTSQELGWLWQELIEHTSMPRRRVLPVAALAAAALIGIDWATRADIRLTLGFIFVLVIAITWVGRALDATVAAVVLMGADAAIHMHTDTITTMGVWWGSASSMLGLTIGIALTRSFRNAMLRLSAQAQHDPLTGLLNTRSFQEATEAERTRAVRSGEPITIAFLDLDHFKQINDDHGHLAGDAVLKAFAECISDSVRAYDIVGRVGGDEFTVVLPNTDEFAAAGVLQRIRHRVAARDDVPCVSVTMGLVTFTFPPATVQDMIRAADQLMYDAKRNHGGGMTLGRVAGGHDLDGDAGPVIEIDFSVHDHRNANDGRAINPAPPNRS